MTRYEIINRTTGQTVTARGRLLESPIERARGLMFKRGFDPDAAFIFPYGDIGRRGVHMMFVFHSIDVVWLQGHEVHHKSTLSPFVGHDSAAADAFIEFPAGGADGIRVGDSLGWGPR